MTGRLVWITQEQRNAFWNAADDLRIEHGPNPISDALYQATEAWDAAPADPAEAIGKALLNFGVPPENAFIAAKPVLRALGVPSDTPRNENT